MVSTSCMLLSSSRTSSQLYLTGMYDLRKLTPRFAGYIHDGRCYEVEECTLSEKSKATNVISGDLWQN